jgi:flagellar assembly protein FliH
MSPEPSFATLTFPSLRTEQQEEVDLRARASGHAAGYAEGLRAANAEIDALRERLQTEHAAVIRHGQARLDRAIEVLGGASAALAARAVPVVAEVQDALAQNALTLAEAILGVELATGDTSARAALTRALSTPDAPLVTTVRLNPLDLAVLDEEIIAAAGVPLVADATLTRGDAMAELPIGYLDARISSAVARARTAITQTTAPSAVEA